MVVSITKKAMTHALYEEIMRPFIIFGVKSKVRYGVLQFQLWSLRSRVAVYGREFVGEVFSFG
jgi:hypothetical protein